MLNYPEKWNLTNLNMSFCLERHFVFSVDKICECNTIQAHGGGGAKEDQPQIFTTYTKDGLVNGHSSYTSLDGTTAIAFNMDHNEWKIQPVADR